MELLILGQQIIGVIIDLSPKVQKLLLRTTIPGIK